MKKSVVVLALVFMLFSVSFVSAGFFQDFFDLFKSKPQLSPPPEVNRCDLLSDGVLDKIKELQSLGEKVVRREGEAINKSEYFVIGNEFGGGVFKITTLTNSSSEFKLTVTDQISQDTTTVTDSMGAPIGTITLKGKDYVYSYNFAGDTSSRSRTITLDFPQTTGDEVMTFDNCIDHCVDTDANDDYPDGFNIWVKGIASQSGLAIPDRTEEDQCIFKGQDGLYNNAPDDCLEQGKCVYERSCFRNYETQRNVYLVNPRYYVCLYGCIDGACNTECTEDWSCDGWSTCTNTQQTRTCTDANDCGTDTNKPSTFNSCTIGGCTEDWDCSNWGECVNNLTTRTCTDSNSCDTTINKPSLSKSCTESNDSSQDCPEYTPPAPGFCEMGTTIDGGVDENNCPRPPKCGFELSNGRNAEIKIMPDVASEKAIEVLGDLDFTVELKEVGKGDAVMAVYEIKGEKQGRFLGIFKIRGEVSALVNTETGKVISTNKPWWAFLASGI